MQPRLISYDNYCCSSLIRRDRDWSFKMICPIHIETVGTCVCVCMCACVCVCVYCQQMSLRGLAVKLVTIKQKFCGISH